MNKLLSLFAAVATIIIGLGAPSVDAAAMHDMVDEEWLPTTKLMAMASAVAYGDNLDKESLTRCTFGSVLPFDVLFTCRLGMLPKRDTPAPRGDNNDVPTGKLRLFPVQFIIANSTDNKLIISFRGTTGPLQLLAEIKDSAGYQIDGDVFRPVVVLDYFWFAYNDLHDLLVATLKPLLLKYPSHQIVLTGHSLGGALATVAAYRLSDMLHALGRWPQLITFGSPRVGNWLFTRKLVEKGFTQYRVSRIVHATDMVAHFPQCLVSWINPLACDIVQAFEVLTDWWHPMTEYWYVDAMPSANTNDTQPEPKKCTANNGEDADCSDSVALKDVFLSIDHHKHYYNMHMGESCPSGQSHDDGCWAPS